MAGIVFLVAGLVLAVLLAHVVVDVINARADYKFYQDMAEARAHEARARETDAHAAPEKKRASAS